MKKQSVITLTLHPAIDRVISIASMDAGATFDGKEMLRVPAGKGVNTARVLKSLRAPAEHIIAGAWLGENESRWFTDTLRIEYGVTTAICPRPCATRFALTFLEAAGRETHIKESMAPPSAKDESRLLAYWSKTVQPGDIVAFCGSAPKGTSDSTLSQLFNRARDKGASFILADTNGDFLDAAGHSRIDLLKGNAAEIGAWLGCEVPFDPFSSVDRKKLLKRLTNSRAPRSVLVTLGASGAILARDGKILFSAPPKLPRNFKIVATTGCGDAATAGVLSSLLLGETASENLLARAVACGAAKLSSADPGALNTRAARRWSDIVGGSVSELS